MKIPLKLCCFFFKSERDIYIYTHLIFIRKVWKGYWNIDFRLYVRHLQYKIWLMIMWKFQKFLSIGLQVNGVRWHQCTYCSKEFKKPSDLVRHIRIHTHEKPYKCTQCFRAFAVKSTLTAHIKTHTGVKDYKCDSCDKLFSTQGSLKVHLRMHTGNQLTPVLHDLITT